MSKPPSPRRKRSSGWFPKPLLRKSSRNAISLYSTGTASPKGSPAPATLSAAAGLGAVATLRRRRRNYVHWGATTQNITQTGDLLQLRKAHRIYLHQLSRIFTALAELADKSKDMALPGRTHGQHAVPATYGLKVAIWIDEFARHTERLRQCEPRVFQALLGGAAGTVASFGDEGLDVQAGWRHISTCRRYGCQPAAL